MPVTFEQLWGAICRIYNEDGTAEKVLPTLFAKLIEFKMVELSVSGLPQLTEYGQKCFTVLEAGDGVVPELNNLATMEGQSQRNDDRRVE